MGLAGGVGNFLAMISTLPKTFMWRYSWSYSDELRSAEGYQVLIDALRMAQTNGSFARAMDYQHKELNQLLLTNEDAFHSVMSQSVEALDGFIQPIMTAEAARQVVITAIALKRYQLKHGNYPSNLGALVPELLPAVPLDPVDGKPLRYRPNQDRTFLLYSVGLNRKDDGGSPALDWVWPQPATDAEIRNYWAHPPK
jgi:hypothetical protein